MSDIVERLKEIAQLKAGDAPPAWLSVTNGWVEVLGKLAGEAAAEIEFLRLHAGAISRGPSFSELAEGLPCREPPDPS
jgi:hypothetical protein